MMVRIFQDLKFDEIFKIFSGEELALSFARGPRDSFLSESSSLKNLSIDSIHYM